MFQMNPTQAIAFLDHTAFRLREPVMMWGQPGSGKSEIVAQLAQRHGAALCDIRASQYESLDFRGLPDFKDDQTHWSRPSTMPFKGNPQFDESAAYIVLFLDEINSGDRSVEAVMYQLINDRRVGEHELMDNVIIIAAGNREGDKGVTSTMALPVCNRFTHLEVVPDVEQWSMDYAMPRGLDPKCVAFFRWRPNLFNTFDPRNPQLGKAFATSRTVTKAIKYYSDALTPPDVKRAQVAGAIGEGPASEMYGFMELFTKIVKIKDVIADPKGCRVPDESEPSMLYATVASVSGAMTLENVVPLDTYLRRLPEEFLILGWMMAMRRDDSLLTSDAFLSLSQTYAHVFKMV